MQLSAGTRLGPYEIQSTIGGGGMGEVYKVRDTRLDRTVAIKILPESLAGDPQFRERFDREARAISQLTHPHICVLHDVGHQDGTDYLVMEYLDGQTLADRIAKGPIPLNEALTIAIQIASALDHAHRAGITHRDLKPGNVMLTKAGVKLLDFGLAKTTPPIAFTGLATAEATMAAPLTDHGTILGTVQYMAPEQVEGKPVDARTDIFAFGAVVYEMVTGKKAFEGKTQASLIAAILEREPTPIVDLQPLATPLLDRTVRRCLAKHADERWQTAHDLRDELKWIAAGAAERAAPAVPVARRRWSAATMVAIVATVTAAALAAALWGVIPSRSKPGPASSPGEAVRFPMFPPPGAVFSGGLFVAPGHALSPDGRRIVFQVRRTGTSAGPSLLWVRSLDAVEAQPLPGTDAATFPFWSPDSQSVGFFADGKLKKIDPAGGAVQVVGDAPAGEGATWNRDGIIVFAPLPTGGLSRVVAAGGQSAPITTLDPNRKEVSHRWPSFLPDGRRFLFLVQPGNTVRLGSLDSGETREIGTADSKVLYAPPGYLVFVRQGTLMAQPFDAGRAETAGDAVPIAESVRHNPALGRAAFSVSENGVLAYRAGADVSQITWFDRAGKRLQSVGEPAATYLAIDLSPDDGHIIVHRHEQTAGGGLWLLDAARGAMSRVTSGPSHEHQAIWSPNGQHIAFASDRGGAQSIYQKVASGAGAGELLLKTDNPTTPTDWSRDGRFIVYDTFGANTRADIWLLPLSGDRKPTLYLRTGFDEGQARLSPDGRWMAYASDETGRFEIYVQSVPASAAKWQVSTRGGVEPTWRRDGKELFYLAGADNEAIVTAVDVRIAGSRVEVGVPRALFATRTTSSRTRALSQTSTRPSYAVAADGQRFLIPIPAGDAPSEPVTVVLNWKSGLAARETR